MNNKKTIIISVVVIATIIILTVGATYAYFTQAGGTGTNTDVNVGTSDQDILSFEVGNPINIETNQTLFENNKGNATGTTYGKAILKTNNQTNELKANYYMYLNITKNEFSYTKDNTPKLLLKVTDASGAELTTIKGLEYKTVTDGLGNTIKGFDITTESGLITILNNKEIIAKSETTEEYNIEVILVNLDYDQSNNAGKSFEAKLQMSKDKYKATLADYIKSQYTTQGENNLYLHDSTLENGANDGSYRYAGAYEEVNNYVCFGSDEETCPTDNLYRIIGVFGDNVKLIKSDFATSETLGTDGAYSKKLSPGAINYSSYKGSLTSISGYYWDRSNGYNNTWSHSLLNTTNLNKNYINYLNKQNAKWSQMIENTTWKIGGNTYANIGETVVNVAYQNEIVNPVTTNTTDGKTEYSAKIGLMYLSDYGYAASPSAWTTTINNYYDSSITSENWMYSGIYEWTITRESDYFPIAFHVTCDGDAYCYLVEASYGVRPVFNLTSSVKYDRGDGSSYSPIRVIL